MVDSNIPIFDVRLISFSEAALSLSVVCVMLSLKKDVYYTLNVDHSELMRPRDVTRLWRMKSHLEATEGVNKVDVDAG